MNPVAAVGTSRLDAAEKDDVVLPFAGDHVVVGDAGYGVCQSGQFVVVRREQRLRPGARPGRQMLGDRPRQAEPVECGGAAADFVEQHQALGRRGVENPGCLLHLQHERGLTAGNVVGSADTGEDAVGERHARLFGRYERADVGEQHDQRRLAQERRLAAHVGAGDDQELLRRVVEQQVIRDERRG